MRSKSLEAQGAFKKPTVYISYSHKDEVWKDRLLLQLKTLEHIGLLETWDDRRIDAGETWYPEIQSAMEHAAAAVLLISPDYLASDLISKEEVPFLLERREREGMVIITVLLSAAPWKFIPWLKRFQMLPRDGKTVEDYGDRYNIVFAEVAEQIAERFANPDYRPPVPESPWPSLLEAHLDITRLPETGSMLFGRMEELEFLNDAWESDATNVVSLVAWGGVGKSTLVNKWLEGLERDNFRGAERVFAWSFYSQGTRERVTSADFFIREALAFFGDPTPDEGSPWDKGERLAKLVGQNRALLVLDGMEPLQSGQAFDRGKVKDPALARLLRKLAKANAGLCVISTRVPVTDLAEMDTVQEVDLERISPEAGRALLRIGGVIAADDALEALAQNFGPHALALNLLGSYLNQHPGEGLHAVATIPDLEAYRERDERHAWNVLAAFETLLGDGPEVEFLRVLGLFDRPAKRGEVQAVREGVPGHTVPVPGLTEHLAELSEGEWHKLLTRLRDLRLLAKQSRHTPDVIEANPLVREYFGLQLQKRFPVAWGEGHNRLYEHLKETTKEFSDTLEEETLKEFPDTLEEMTRLFQAVVHGCQAGRQQEALDSVFKQRIMRDDKQRYSVTELNAFSATLAVLRGFFSEPWSHLSESLDEKSKGYVLHQVGYCLRSLGRLLEAIPPLKASVEIGTSTEEWHYLSIRARILGQIYLTTGEIGEGVRLSRLGFDIAKREGDKEEQDECGPRLAGALHDEGKREEAYELFQEAEAFHRKLEPEHPFLIKFEGFLFCELLLDRGRLEEVRDRCRNPASKNERPFHAALRSLCLGRADLFEARKPGAVSLKRAALHLDTAVTCFRLAGEQQHLPRGLLARAALRRVQTRFPEAWADVEEALEIAEQGSMRLFQADGLLESARLHCEEKKFKQARACLAEAKVMIDKMGYHRRDREVDALERVLP